MTLLVCALQWLYVQELKRQASTEEAFRNALVNWERHMTPQHVRSGPQTHQGAHSTHSRAALARTVHSPAALHLTRAAVSAASWPNHEYGRRGCLRVFAK